MMAIAFDILNEGFVFKFENKHLAFVHECGYLSCKALEDASKTVLQNIA